MVQFRPADDQPPLIGPATDGRIAKILVLADFVTVLRQLGVLARVTGGAALIVRFADVKGARPRNPSDTARHRRRGDRLSVNFAPLVA